MCLNLRWENVYYICPPPNQIASRENLHHLTITVAAVIMIRLIRNDIVLPEHLETANIHNMN